jgi:hypothetical protein
MPQKQRSIEAIERLWEPFTDAVRQRLVKGANEYGDTSLDLSGSALLEEVGQELLDVCGWSFILWLRIRELKSQLARMEEHARTFQSSA